MSTINKEQKLEKIDHVIEKAMNKVGVNKAYELCKFIPEKDGHLHHFTLKRLKMHDTQRLEELLKKYILNQEQPKKFPSKPRKPYKKKAQKFFKEGQKLEKVIRIALMTKKLREEKDLCHFLIDEKQEPIKFELFNQLKKNEPHRLRKLIDEQIVHSQSLVTSSFSHQQLVATQPIQSQNNKDLSHLMRALEKLCECVKNSKPLDKHEKPKREVFGRALEIVKQELIYSIKQKQADQELWETYNILLREV